MAEQYVQLANYLVWPSESDHHGDDYGTGAGLILEEPVITSNWYNTSAKANRVISGFQLPVAGSITNATITAGQACIGGYLIKGTDACLVTFPDDMTCFVYLKLNVTSEKVIQPVFDIINTTRVTPTTRYYLLLGTVVTSGGSCTASGVDMRQEGRHIWGSVVHSEAGTSTIDNAGSANWAVSKSSARSVITFDIPFAFKKPCVTVTGNSNTAYWYSRSTTTILVDAADAEVFDFHAIG